VRKFVAEGVWRLDGCGFEEWKGLGCAKEDWEIWV
jgi:hypothetical protein